MDEITEIQTEVTTVSMIPIPEETTTTITECQLLTLQTTEETLNVKQLNTFTYLGSALAIACLFWFTVKYTYRLFKFFF